MLFIISLTQLDIMDLMWQSFLLHLALLPIIMLCTTASCTGRSLQKVQGHRAGVDVDLTQSLWDIPISCPVALCDTQCPGKQVVKTPV